MRIGSSAFGDDQPVRYNLEMDDSRNIEIFRARVVLDRLERLSADSRYAHQASGIRGGLLRILSSMEMGLEETELERLRAYTRRGNEILV
jgi:hypothetical protein